jgi:hypothetical protein
MPVPWMMITLGPIASDYGSAFVVPAEDEKMIV